MVFLYYLNIILVLTYIAFGFDDFIWDMYSLIRGFFERKSKIDKNKLFNMDKKHLAITIAAWKEHNVIERVIDNVIDSQIYPVVKYDIFIGVYPNDLDTIEAVKRIEGKYKNVHMVINHKNGPTTKAQNLNYVFSKIKEFEVKNNITFEAITIHDSEDIIHPYEMLVTNYLMDDYEALQFPVIPLMEKPTFKNFFRTITSNTYADEFAENHYIGLVNRSKLDAFVPSAGTGFSIRRDILDILGYTVLPEESLTEDYKLSLSLYENGIRLHYVMERVKRIRDDGSTYWDYVATRSIFPSTFKSAVKQKTRWITGITMQSYKFRNIATSGMSIVGRYSVYKDQKAKIGNLISPIGYPVVIYIGLALIFNLPSIYPNGHIFRMLSLIVLFLALSRQALRGVALYNIYGLRSVFFGILFPPLLPLRWMWGNLINFISTIRAYGNSRKMKKQISVSSGNKKTTNKNKSTQVKWDKTDHEFVSGNVLNAYHRKVGDMLIYKGYISAYMLSVALYNKPLDRPIGQYLIEQGFINADQLYECLELIGDSEDLKI